MYIDYLSKLDLVDALWWFIENHEGLEVSECTEVFFYLRERYRNGK